MFEGLITMILNKVLGDFIENIDSNQLDISLTNGEVVMKNMKVKSTIFDSLPVPFSLVYGQVGLIYIKVPVWNLMNQPLIIEIRDILIIARPKHINEWNEEVEIKSYTEAQQSAIEEYEIFSQNAEKMSSKDPTSVEKLANKIIQNIQVNVENVYLRYEDEYSASNHGTGKFAMGILLREFSTISSSKDWKKSGEGGPGGLLEDITHKVAVLRNFSVFLDYDEEIFTDKQNDQPSVGTNQVIGGGNQAAQSNKKKPIEYEKLQSDTTNKIFLNVLKAEFRQRNPNHKYIIDNFELETRVKLNKDPKKNLLPQLELELILGDIFDQVQQNNGVKISCHQPQVIRILKLVEYIGYYNEFQSGALAKFKGRKIDQDVADEYIKLYCEWKLWKENKKKAKLAEEKRIHLKNIENCYTYDKIIILRQFANKVLDQQSEQRKKEADIEKKVEKMDKSMSWLFQSSKKVQEQKKQLEEYRYQLQRDLQDEADEQKSKLEQELTDLTSDLSKQQLLDKDELDKMPDGYTRFKFHISIPSLKVTFVNEFDQLLFEATIEEQDTRVDIGIGQLEVHYQIYGLTLQDHWTGAKAYPYILTSQEISKESGQVIHYEENKDQLEKKQAIIFKLWQNDAFKITPFKIEVKSEKTLFIVGNFHLVKEISRSFSRAFEGEQLDFSYFSEAATQKALQYMKNGKEFIEQIQRGEFQHKAIDIQLFLTAPIIIIPQNVFKPNLPVFYLDIGSIELHSNLLEFNKEEDYKLCMVPSQLYDKYEGQLSNFQIGMLNDGLTDGIKSFTKGSGYQVLKEFQANIVFMNCVEPMHPIYPTAELDIIIKNFGVTFGQKFIGNVLKVNKLIIDQMESIEQQIFQSVSIERKPSKLVDQEGHEFIKKLREKQQLEKLQKENEEQKQDDSYYQALSQEVKPVIIQIGKRKETEENIDSIKPPGGQNQMQASAQLANFKVYVQVENLELLLLKEKINKETKLVEGYQDMVKVQFLYTGVEIEVDRQKDLHLNATTLRLTIEDVNPDDKIIKPFRKILSSPMVDSQRFNNVDQFNSDSEQLSSNELENQKLLTYNGGAMARSLLYQIRQETQPLNDQDSEIPIINQFEMQMFIHDEDDVDLDFVLSDQRIIATVPTAQMVMNVVVSVLLKIEQMQTLYIQYNQVRLQKYERVLQKLTSEFEDDADKLLQKIIINLAKENNLEPEVAQSLFQQYGIQRLTSILNTDSIQVKLEQKLPLEIHKSSSWVNSIPMLKGKLHEIDEEKKCHVSINIKLNNCSIWAPMYCETENTQIVHIQLMGEMRFYSDVLQINTYETTLKEFIRKDVVKTNDNMSIAITHFMISTMSFKDQKPQSNKSISSFLRDDMIDTDRYTSQNLLEPCRVLVHMNAEDHQKTLFLKTTLGIDIDPMHFKVVFRQIDCINIIISQVVAMIDKVKVFWHEKILARDQYKIDTFVAARVLEEEKQLYEQEKISLDDVKFDTRKFRFEKYGSTKIKESTSFNLKVECEAITFEVSDDTAANGNQPFINLAIQHTQVSLRSYEKEDDAATFILKKLGVWQRNNPQLAFERMCTDLSVFTQISINYYNQRSLVFEPLLEPWHLIVKIQQQAEYTQVNNLIESDKELNINFTYEMAKTVRKLIERSEESFNQANIFTKIYEGDEVSSEQQAKSMLFRKRLLDTKQSFKLGQNSDDDLIGRKNLQNGFIFQNFTGLQLKAGIHDDMTNDNLEMIDSNQIDNDEKGGVIDFTMVRKPSTLMYNPNHIMVFANSGGKTGQGSQPVHKSADDLYTIAKYINARNHKGNSGENLDDDPLKIDIKLDGLQKITEVPIEGLGVFSYRAYFVPDEEEKEQFKEMVITQQANSNPSNTAGNRFKRLKNKLVQKVVGTTNTNVQQDHYMGVGIIVNIKMDGHIKKVFIESSVLIVNNLKRPVTILMKNDKYEDHIVFYDDIAIMEANGGVFRVPFNWIYNEQYNNSLYVMTSTGDKQLLFQNLDEIFTDRLQYSQLSKYHSQIVKLDKDFHASIDVITYQCLPRSQADKPPQYVIYINDPLMVSNYNFQSLELADSTTKTQLAVMGPKESTHINHYDFLSKRMDIDWIFYENENNTMILHQKALNMCEKINTKSIETFGNVAKTYSELKTYQLIMEYKTIHYQQVNEYNENFELRPKLKEYTSSMSIMVYPKYMIVNKTSIPFTVEKQIFNPFSNDYFMPDANSKVTFSVPGYKRSYPIDVNTIGLSGLITLELNSKQSSEIKTQFFPHQNQYIPEVLEFGISINTAVPPFNHTVLITLQPRYVFINRIGVPLIFKQKGSKSQVIINNDQMQAYNFEINKNRQVMIRQPGQYEHAMIKDGKNPNDQFTKDELFYWSSPFSIDDVEDFQIQFHNESQQEIEDRKWYHPSEENNFKRFVRVIITTQNEATILVVFCNPAYPEYELQNNTDISVEFAQLQEEGMLNSHVIRTQDEMAIDKFRVLRPKQSIPFAWSQRMNQNKKLALRIQDSILEINIDQATKKYEIQTPKKERYHIEVRVQGNNKKFIIQNINKKGQGFNRAVYLQSLLRRHQEYKQNLKIKLKGLCVSLIDENPQETLLLTLYQLRFQLQEWVETKDDENGEFEKITKFTLILKHLQLDNMLNTGLPVVLSPVIPLIKDEQKSYVGIRMVEELKSSNTEDVMDGTPFIQAIISIAEDWDVTQKNPQVRLKTAQFSLQEFLIQCDTSILNINIKLLVEMFQIFTEGGIKIYPTSVEFFEKAKVLPREAICDDLDAKRALVEENETVYGNKNLIELIHLGAIRAYISLKVEKEAVELDVSDPRRGFGIINLLYNILAGVATISNSPISFKELILIDTFASPDILTKILSRNYKNQAMRQFYKIIGSSDLIGNPVGLVSKLGTGVYEFISEPSKGLLKGPDEFVGGVRKGVSSLVTNVVSGGFESVSKITGSLYSVVKSVSGEKNVQIQRSENIKEGIFQGVKGGVSEIIGGVTGLVTKPIRKTQQEGAKGFIKGLGSGIVGALTAPITATLRAGSSVSQGVANTANKAGGLGKIKFDSHSQFSRFRPPRYINTKNVITVFNEEIAIVSKILSQIYNGRFSTQTIKIFTMMPETKVTGELVNKDPSSAMLIITNSMLFYLKIEKEGSQKGKPTPIFKARLWRVRNCVVYQVALDSQKYQAQYVMVITCRRVLTKGLKEFTFQSNDYNTLEKIYNILQMLPQVDAENKVKNESSKAKRFECCT